MELKRGLIFRNLTGVKCYVANVFKEGDNDIVTFRYWNKYRKKWVFVTEFEGDFIIRFEGGAKWQ